MDNDPKKNDLDRVGLRLPEDELRVPKDLGNLDLTEIRRDLGGVKIQSLFPGAKIPFSPRPDRWFDSSAKLLGLLSLSQLLRRLRR